MPPMDAGVRAGLYVQHISTLPKLDTPNAVVEFVKSQARFSKSRAAEGHAYMTSWKNEETMVNAQTRPAQSSAQDIGFATPVLKPRVPRTVKVGESQKNPTRQEPNAETLTKPNSRTVGGGNKSKLSVQEKPANASRSSKRKTGSKRTRNLQSDEETRLQERRDRRRVKRKIMRPEESPAEKAAARKDGEDESPSRLKPSKARLPAGLALMYGFTATNVGKHRLTIDPPIRSGVFGKGRASLPTQTGKTRVKGRRVSGVFSEVRFLKSSGKAKSGSTSVAPSLSSASQSSGVSFVFANGHSQPPQQSRLDKAWIGSTAEDTIADAEKNQNLSQPSPQQLEPPRPSSAEVHSVVWDIERDTNVLPSRSSSLSLGPKPNADPVDATQKKWAPDIPAPPATVASLQQKRPRLEGQTANSSAYVELPDQVIRRKSPSSIISANPSESPSKEVEPGQESGDLTRSKYFRTCSPHTKPPTDEEPIATQPPENLVAASHDFHRNSPEIQSGRSLSFSDFASEEIGYELPYSLERDAVRPAGPHMNQCLDWLFSDRASSDDALLQDGVCILAEERHGTATTLRRCEDQIQDAKAFPGGDEMYMALPPEDQALLIESVMFNPQIYEERFSNDDNPLNKQVPPVLHDRDTYQLPSPAFIDLTEEGLCDFDRNMDGGAYDDLDVLSNETSLDSGTDDDLAEPSLLFNEGRKLLFGYAARTSGLTRSNLTESIIESIEADVARHLVDHWMPQKY